jgi:hypothetical protein
MVTSQGIFDILIFSVTHLEILHEVFLFWCLLLFLAYSIVSG